MWFFILFLSSVLTIQNSETASDVTVKEVAAGHLAELPCLSIDEHHRFMFWQLEDNDIIGPGNPLNEKKYNYEVLTGLLQIRVSNKIIFVIYNTHIYMTDYKNICNTFRYLSILYILLFL